MNNFFKEGEFYPTPKHLLDKILDGVNWGKVNTVLEPSAGSGNIVGYIREVSKKAPHYARDIDIDCIEKDDNFKKLLKGSGERVVHDDFLSYLTFKKYDMIIMNPPFSNGDRHLLKAISLQEKTGGDIICILNAETIKNPYTLQRKELLQKLEDAGALIEFMQGEFESADAERKTSVEIAVIKVHYEAPELHSDILNKLKTRYYSESSEEFNELAAEDIIENLTKAYQLEVEAGIELIREYKALTARTYKNGNILRLTLETGGLSVNQYVCEVRMKYWDLLFGDERITGRMTDALLRKFRAKVQELRDYEFSVYNIKQMQIEMNKELIGGIEECIIELFDELSFQHSWYPEMQKNLHYYNGWATNKAWIINKKVIIPFYGQVWSTYNKEYQPDYYDVVQKLADIEKALNYLDGGLTDSVDLGLALRSARITGQTKNIHLRYFDITFYKKGTCHITFTNEELLKKFNIFGSQKKGWLPQSYGRKKYSEMNSEEKAVINEFEGEVSYNKVMAEPSRYIVNVNSMPLIKEKTA